MKRFIALVLFCFSCIGCHHAADAVDIHGNNIYLDDYKGKWVVVNYWAQWCHPCLKELPALEKFQQQHKDDAIVIGVNFDGWDNQKLIEFSNQHKLHFVMTNQFPIAKFGVDNIANVPMTFIINPEGKLQQQLLGPQTEITLANAVQTKTPHANL